MGTSSSVWDAETKLRLVAVGQRHAIAIARELLALGVRDGISEVASIHPAATPPARPSVALDEVAIRSLFEALVVRMGELPAKVAVAAHVRANLFQAIRIADTEAFNAYNAGRFAVEQSLLAHGETHEFAIPRTVHSLSGEARRVWRVGIVVRWNALVDRRTCAVCRALDGTLRPLGASFDGRLTPPAHPRCRCAAQYWPIAVSTS